MSVKKRCFGLAAALSCALLVCGGLPVQAAAAHEAVPAAYAADVEADPRGWMANLSIRMGSEGDRIWGQAKNEFTLFPSTIEVYVELYSSTEYPYSFREMELEAEDYTADLNMGDALRVYASTGGEQKYWLARMRYKFDDRNWAEELSPIFVYSADGEFLGEAFE